MKKIFSCRSCQDKNFKEFFDLGKQPFANSFLTGPNQKEKFYPLSLSWCANCNLVQLNQTANPKELFSNYIWLTSTSKKAGEFSEIFCHDALSHAKNIKVESILEIGSNDGTFLRPFIHRGFEVLGIDPAENIAKIARQSGIPTKSWFFGVKIAKKILKSYGSSQIVIARNVLPHVADTRGFVKGLALCLDPAGILIIEVHYGGKILEGLHYDSIYHEHLCYFTLKTLEKLLNTFGLYIYDIGISPINNGGLIVYAKKNKVGETRMVKKYREKESRGRINDFTTWQNFAKQSFAHRENLLKLLAWAKSRGKIFGYGASARSSTLLNFCNINSTLIQKIADDSLLKQGLYTPGTHILITSPKLVRSEKPDFVLILAWNFANEVINKLKKDFKFYGSYILPLPNDPIILSA